MRCYRFERGLGWIAIVSLFLLFSPSVIFARTSIPKESLQELQLFYPQSELVMTPTRSLKPIQESPAMATVITHDQISKMGAGTLKDIIPLVPGFALEINDIGNPVIVVRGVKSYQDEKILLMIDGHRVNEAHCGGSAWNFADMPLGNVKRVEFIRGPGSASYGEDAFIAVINVITYQAVPGYRDKARQLTRQHNLSVGDNKTFENFVSLKTGSFNTYSLNGLWHHSWENWALTVFGRYFNTNGDHRTVYSDYLDINPYTAPYSLAPAPVDDWHEQEDLDCHISYKNISTHIRYLNKRQGPYIGITHVLTNGSRRTISHIFCDTVWHRDFSKDSSIKLRGYVDRFKMDNLWVGYPAGYLDNPGFEDGVRGEVRGTFDSFGFESQFRTRITKDHKVLIGAEMRVQHQFNIGYWANFDPTNSTAIVPLPGGFQNISYWANWASKTGNWDHNDAVYVQDVWSISHYISLTTGLRYDYYDSFKSVLDPRIGLVWRVASRTWLKVLYGQAFRSPSFLERFTINNPAIVGNPRLNPERVYTSQIGVQKDMDHTTMRADVFFSKFKDLIVPISQSQQSAAVYENHGSAIAEGFELSVKDQVSEALLLRANYSFVYAKDKDTDRRIPGSIGHTANFLCQYSPELNTFIYMRLYICGRVYRGPDDTRPPVPAYAIVDLSFLRKRIFNTGFSAQLIVKNLLNKQYASPSPANTVAFDYPRPGREIYGVLKYSF